MPTVICLATAKGGSGKTMMAQILAGEFANRKMSVGLIDMDVLETLTKWHVTCTRRNRMPSNISLEIARTVEALEVALDKLSSADLILIDLPGTGSALFVAACLQADLILMPVKPAAADIDACLGTWRAILQSVPAGMPTPLIRFVFTQVVEAVIAKHKTMKEAVEQLLEADADLFDNTVSYRPTFVTMANGHGTLYTLPEKSVALISARHNAMLVADEVVRTLEQSESAMEHDAA